MRKYEKVVSNPKDGEFIGHVELDGKKVANTERTSASKIGISSLLGTVIKGLPPITAVEEVEGDDEWTEDDKEKVEEILPTPSEVEDKADVAIILEETQEEPQEVVPTEVVEQLSKEKMQMVGGTHIMVDEEIPLEHTIPSDVIIGVDMANGSDQSVKVTIPNKKFVGDKFDVEQHRKNYIKNLKNKVSDIIEIDGIRVHIIPSLWASSLKFKHKEVGYSLEILNANEIIVSRVLDINLGVDYFENHIPKLVAWINDGLKLEKTGKTIHNHNNANSMVIWDFNTYQILAIVPATKY